ncbi:MAG TPA: PDDEXK nuclease domain-containing protein [Solirubrobacteraceae bacterium]|nr:PDDEXK nuclease domain-containing protein [Solirubrobacteraceae bacterium]
MAGVIFIDLLFYNYLRRFVVIDLKVEDFKPEFAGKMNFSLNAVDELELDIPRPPANQRASPRRRGTITR